MKTFLTTLGLTALLAVAIFTARVFAQDENTFVPAPDQPLFQANTPQPAFAADQSPLQTTAQGTDSNSITFQDFYNQLSSQGTWIKTDQYGDVWQPTENDPNWRPYTYGHWDNSDQGMLWVSDEPFGWATYHYGRWANLNGYGWVWAPGYTWAPAWVSWRDGNEIGNANNTSNPSEAIDTSDTSDYGDYCGWAPLPPDTFLGIDFFDPGFFGLSFGFGSGYWGFHIGDDCDVAYGIGPGCYNFCPVGYLGDPHAWRHFADRRDNFAIINHTRNVTNLNVANNARAGEFGRVHSDGPGSAALARSHTPIENVRLTGTSSLTANGGRNGNALAVYAPDVQNRAGVHPSRVSENLGNVTVNHGTNIAQPLGVNSHLTGAAPTTEQIHAAKVADGNAPAGARVAHADTEFTRTLNEPLGTYRPTTTAGSNIRPATTTSAVNPTPSTFHASSASSSAFTGEPATHHTTAASSNSSFFGGFFHHYSSSGTTTAHTSIHHSSPPPSYHPSYGSSSFSSMFHSSSSSYHPQPSSHFAPPSAHYGGGAPSFHFSGGGGVHSSGGGGHSSGGGHSGGGNNQQHH